MRWVLIILAGILLLMPVMSLAQRASGNFTLQDAADVDDSYMDENNATTNYETDTALSVGAIGIITQTDFRSLIRWPNLVDSLNGRDVDSAVIGLPILSVFGTWGTDDSLYVYAVKRVWTISTVSWTNAVGGGDPTAWTTGGCDDATTDRYGLLIDVVPLNGLIAGDTIYADVELAFDSGWIHWGFRLSWNLENSAESFKPYSSESGDAPWLYVEWMEADRIESHSCADGMFGSNDWYSVSKFATKTYAVTVDSAFGRVDPSGATNDSMWFIIYAEDSTYIDSSSLTLPAGETECTDFKFTGFSGGIISADSFGYFGMFVSEDENTWDFCTMGTGVGLNVCIYGTASNQPNPLTGTVGLNGNCPCFTVYLTEVVAGGQVIIIGSCLEKDDVIYADGNCLRYLGGDMYVVYSDPVFIGR